MLCGRNSRRYEGYATICLHFTRNTRSSSSCGTGTCVVQGGESSSERPDRSDRKPRWYDSGCKDDTQNEIRQNTSACVERIGRVCALQTALNHLELLTLHVTCADHLPRNAVHGEFDKEVQVPTTIEDIDVVTIARGKVREYFETKGKNLHKSTETRSKL
jgi:hypothetical protein